MLIENNALVSHSLTLDILLSILADISSSSAFLPGCSSMIVFSTSLKHEIVNLAVIKKPELNGVKW